MTVRSSPLGTLADWKVSGRLEALAWAGRKALCRELCDGLHFLHASASVVHRDLKVIWRRKVGPNCTPWPSVLV